MYSIFSLPRNTYYNMSIPIDYLAEFGNTLILYSQSISCVIKKSGQLTHKGEIGAVPAVRPPDIQNSRCSVRLDADSLMPVVIVYAVALIGLVPRTQPALPQSSPTFSNQILFSLFLQS